MPLDRTLLPVERLLHSSDLAMIGEWRCPPDAAWFRDSGPVRNHVFVFPRTPVRIVRGGREALVADAGLVMLYNRGDEYRREALSAVGDRCEWFTVAPELLEEALHDVLGAANPERPFLLSHVFVGNAPFLQQRRLVSALRGGHSADPLAVEEMAIGLLNALAAGHRQRPSTRVTTAHVELVARARQILTATLTERLKLAQIASSCGVSPWFLARIFRRVTGTTIHDYRERLRLRASLESVAAGRDLSSVALDLGFASHSHFTQAFRRGFGIAPSRFRQEARAPRFIAASPPDPCAPRAGRA